MESARTRHRKPRSVCCCLAVACATEPPTVCVSARDSPSAPPLFALPCVSLARTPQDTGSAVTALVLGYHMAAEAGRKATYALALQRYSRFVTGGCKSVPTLNSTSTPLGKRCPPAGQGWVSTEGKDAGSLGDGYYRCSACPRPRAMPLPIAMATGAGQSRSTGTVAEHSVRVLAGRSTRARGLVVLCVLGKHCLKWWCVGGLCVVLRQLARPCGGPWSVVCSSANRDGINLSPYTIATATTGSCAFSELTSLPAAASWGIDFEQISAAAVRWLLASRTPDGVIPCVPRALHTTRWGRALGRGEGRGGGRLFL